jgi:hypothetical protein
MVTHSYPSEVPGRVDGWDACENSYIPIGRARHLFVREWRPKIFKQRDLAGSHLFKAAIRDKQKGIGFKASGR